MSSSRHPFICTRNDNILHWSTLTDSQVYRSSCCSSSTISSATISAHHHCTDLNLILGPIAEKLRPHPSVCLYVWGGGNSYVIWVLGFTSFQAFLSLNSLPSLYHHLTFSMEMFLHVLTQNNLKQTVRWPSSRSQSHRTPTALQKLARASSSNKQVKQWDMFTCRRTKLTPITTTASMWGAQGCQFSFVAVPRGLIYIFVIPVAHD